jgi:arginine/ornithine transport system permease protein
MNWDVIFREDSLAMYGEGIVTTLWLLVPRWRSAA